MQSECAVLPAKCECCQGSKRFVTVRIAQVLSPEIVSHDVRPERTIRFRHVGVPDNCHRIVEHKVTAQRAAITEDAGKNE